MENSYFAYIVASQRNGTIYMGVTNNLIRRASEHHDSRIAGFTRDYGCKLLVWYRRYPCIHSAIRDEKRLKRWRRAWKIGLIEERNPQWLDLRQTLIPA